MVGSYADKTTVFSMKREMVVHLLAQSARPYPVEVGEGCQERPGDLAEVMAVFLLWLSGRGVR